LTLASSATNSAQCTHRQQEEIHMPDESHQPRTPRRLYQRLIGAVLALVLLGGFATSRTPANAASKAPRPTVVLVHGAFADASSWSGVATRLIHSGYPVIAPAIPMRDLAQDAAYLSSVLATIDGPIILVGHSYGGAVITDAATGNPKVKALVYIAGFALDNGESLADISGAYTNSDLGTNLQTRQYPLADGSSGTDLYINPVVFRDVFARDVATATTAVMAVTQRPLSLAAFASSSSVPAWQTIPTWYMVATKDRAIDPAAERFMASRASAHTLEVKSSHAVLVSHPNTVAGFIASAADAVS
jgi:pimeloyl-ACP methyl ester carboxylesterase